MPLIYLKHPEHGCKVANIEAEATYDETNGWVRYDPSVLPKEVTVANELLSKPKSLRKEVPA